jgi:thioredoxin-related protein
MTIPILSKLRPLIVALSLALLGCGLAYADGIQLAMRASTGAQAVIVPETKDLKALGEDSKRSGLPIILVFSADDCEHCERLEEDVLRPLIYSGELEDMGLLRKYKVDGVVSILDFDGQRRDAEDYSILRDVEFTPTIQIMDANGKEIVPAIVGYQTPGLFLAYLKEAIKTSKKILREKTLTSAIQ